MSRIQAANADASEEEDSRVRHLEDPYLVGEEAAARARNERLARKYEDDILILEDRRWDRWLGKLCIKLKLLDIFRLTPSLFLST